jgi:hypothetical protein
LWAKAVTGERPVLVQTFKIDKQKPRRGGVCLVLDKMA